MRDPLRVYEIIHRFAENMRSETAGGWKVGLLIAVAVATGWRIVFWWLGGTISSAEAFVLCLAVVLAEAAAVSWIRDFGGLQFVLLLALPLAVLLAVEAISRVASRESHRSFTRADIRRYRAAIQRDPRNVAAHVLLGDAHMRLGQRRRGLGEYRAALELQPESYEIRYKVEHAARLLGST